MTERALLALEDGTVFGGRALGARGTSTGEVCFNTGMTGYQEVLTDPSYNGQIVAMTAPHIGNTGTNRDDDQAPRPWVAGFVVRDASALDSSWRSESSLEDYLVGHGIVGVDEVDTRRLTRHIRSAGAMRAVVTSETTDPDEAVAAARAAPSYAGRDLVREVTTERAYAWGPDRLEGRARLLGVDVADRTPRHRIVAYDFGIKRNILDLLAAAGFDVEVVPATTPADEVLAGGYAGVFLSNGPGDPEPLTYAIDAVRAVVGRVPLFGICLGHQILGLAMGASTFKLRFGHRGSNQPVRRLDGDRVEITCQNHGFAVDAASLERTRARATHVNLNDGTIEGLEIPGVAFGVQYHPEAGPGPHDARHLFDRFRDLIDEFEPEEVT